MKSLIAKHQVIIAGRKTSVSLEDDFWTGLKKIAKERRVTLAELVGSIKAQGEYHNFSSRLRLFALEYYRNRAEASLRRH
jgi:predicted DNA-binding ribbon-helix-helix protein